MPRPDWTVLLLGGGSGTGKSTLAARLSRRLGIPWMHADDIRMALQRVVSADAEPLLHFFDDDANWQKHTAEQLTATHAKVSAIACKGLAIVVSHHIAMSEPAILEGDDILPEFARLMLREHGSAVRAAFLHEPDADAIRTNMLGRDRGIRRRSVATREKMIALGSADGERLASGAQRRRLPVVEPRPFRTLATRVLSAIA